MTYDKACYKRRKDKIIAKANTDPDVSKAYTKIRDRWWFDDLKIKRLLDEHTVTEIMFGDIYSGEFLPKEIICIVKDL